MKAALPHARPAARGGPLRKRRRLDAAPRTRHSAAGVFGAQRLSGRAVGSYVYATPARTQLAHRTLPLSAYVHALAHHLPPPVTLPRLVQCVHALFDPAATLPTEPLAHLHAYVHRRLPADDPLRPALEAELQAYAHLPPRHPLVPRKSGRWVHAARQPAPADRRVLRVPVAEATGAYASLRHITSPFRALAPRFAWQPDPSAVAMELHTDADAWEAVDALQLMHAHRVARAPRFPRLLRHWFAATGDSEVDRVRRAAVRRVLLAWVDPAAAQYELHEHPAEPHTAGGKPEPAAAAVLDQLFGFLADGWDSVGALAADLYTPTDAASDDEASAARDRGDEAPNDHETAAEAAHHRAGIVDILRTLLLLGARHLHFEIERATLGWLVDAVLARHAPGEVAALHGAAFAHVRHLWLEEEGAVPVRAWLDFAERAPVCAFLAFARSPLLTPAERRRVLRAVRVAGAAGPAPPRARELYAPRSEWRAWSYTQHVLADPRVRPTPPAPQSAETEAELQIAGALLPMLEYSLYFRCTPAKPERLLASLADHGFDVHPVATYLDRTQHWAVTTAPAAGDAVRYDHEVLLQLYDAPTERADETRVPDARQTVVHGIVQHWGVPAYARFRDAATARVLVALELEKQDAHGIGPDRTGRPHVTS